MNISGTTAVCGIIANPVEHSLSPVMHNYIARRMGIDLAYVPFKVPVESVETVLTGAYFMNILGMNATIPHKMAVIPYLKDIAPAAKAIKAVNTLVRTEGGYKGYNTDYSGFGRALKENQITVAHYPAVIVLGAGGAAKACCCLLADSGADKIYILNRTGEKAQQLAEELLVYKPGLSVVSGTLADWRDILTEQGYLVIQTTSVGMYPKVHEAPIEETEFYRLVDTAYDIVYTPEETKFLRCVREQGGRGYNGLDMLLYQGVDAFELWTGHTVPKEVAEGAMEEMRHVMRRKRPLFLIGFMGAGKTTVGEALAKLADVSMADTDRMIEEEQNTTVSSIFREQGENCFRDMETTLVKQLSEEVAAGTRTSGVISVGGGLAVREENRRCMRECGTVVYLRTGKDTLVQRLQGDTTRPLLAGDGLEKRISAMMAEREEFYLEAADFIVDTDGKLPEEIAEEIHHKIY